MKSIFPFLLPTPLALVLGAQYANVKGNSEQTDRIIARNFVDVLNGKSKYATYYSS